jgi:3-dehydroquinate synthase
VAHENIRVELGARSYDIVIGSEIIGDAGEALKGFGLSPRIALVSNPTVMELYGGQTETSLRNSGFDPIVITIPDGEEYKNLLWMEQIWGELLKLRLDRNSAVLALGGGVIGDMAGFAASAYMRGIRYVQVPTTLLAQVDSSVGGKTGVNHPLGKNMIGAFWQPSLVWIDVDTLNTLPRNELLAGLAEVIKYGVIWDEEFFKYIDENKDAILSLEADALAHIIASSCRIKADVVSRDEREAGLRAILNYGHTVGHAIETTTGYTRYLHGEAVAIGMNIEAVLAVKMGLMSEDEALRVKGLIESYGLPTDLPKGVGSKEMLEAMELDKKALAGQLRFTLPERVGRAKVNEPVGKDVLTELIESL